MESCELLFDTESNIRHRGCVQRGGGVTQMLSEMEKWLPNVFLERN